jgi:hypothetical protein
MQSSPWSEGECEAEDFYFFFEFPPKTLLEDYLVRNILKVNYPLLLLRVGEAGPWSAGECEAEAFRGPFGCFACPERICTSSPYAMLRLSTSPALLARPFGSDRLLRMRMSKT